MLISADKRNHIDPPIHNFLIGLDVDMPTIPLTRLPDYEFNDRLYQLDRWCLIDYIEYGANEWKQDITHVWGKNTELFKDRFKDRWDEWIKFDKFCQEKPPAVTFKRELLKKDVTDTLLPCEYVCHYPKYQIQTREEFNARPIELLHYWGHSNESRREFQGNAWLHAIKEDITICDNIYYVNNFLQDNHRRLWATINIPHFARLPLQEVLVFNGMAKLSLSLSGDGIKCFRHAEAPINSIMVMPNDELAWTYEWVHGVNCIKFDNNPIQAIEEALRRDDLYDIYLKGMETLDKYRVGNYLNNYLKPIIDKA